jgi:glycerol kinase
MARRGAAGRSRVHHPSSGASSPRLDGAPVSVILVLDVGTTTMRAALVDEHLRIVELEALSMPPSTPFPGLVEFDAAAMADAVLGAVTSVLARGPAPVAVGITNQRASTIVWDRATGEPIGPGIGWQDLRTVFDCITAKAEHGVSLAPNQSITKIAWLLTNVDGARDRDLCFGTVDTWLAWTLTGGAAHVTDRTNAAVTGLCGDPSGSWKEALADSFGIPTSLLPHIVDSTGVIAEATALPGSPPIAALVGDQQASLVGQGCVRSGQAKITLGSGGMLDLCTGSTPPASHQRGAHGTYPIVAWSRDGVPTWGTEAIMLSAGTNVQWLVEDLGVVGAPEATHELAASVPSSEGVVYVPALLGLGTPSWDFGARGTLLGITRGTTVAHLVRAVLEGVAQRAVDLVEAAEADTGLTIETLRIDGGMSTNPTFVQALADLSRRVVEVSPVADATTLGAAFLAGLAVGTWSAVDEAAALWGPQVVAEPGADRSADRERWADALRRASGWIPELSALDF